MNIKKIVSGFLKKEDVIEEVPQVEMHPKFREYLENGWVRLVLNEDKTQVTLNGKQLYEIIEFDYSVPQSRILMYELVMQQAVCFGMTRKNMDFNDKMQHGVKKRMDEAHRSGNNELYEELSSQYDFNFISKEQVKEVGLDDELVLNVSMIWHITEDEDPSKFDQIYWKKKVEQAKKDDLSLFFYTKGLTILSRGLQFFTEDFQSFTQEVMDLNLKNQQMILSTIQRYLNGPDSMLNKELYLSCNEQMEALNWRIEWLKAHRMNFTFGS